MCAARSISIRNERLSSPQGEPSLAVGIATLQAKYMAGTFSRTVLDTMGLTLIQLGVDGELP